MLSQADKNMPDPADIIADSPSHHFELLIGYVTDATNDVQSFKVRKMDNMGDFIWADALSTKLGRIKQLATELKMGFDQGQPALLAGSSSNGESAVAGTSSSSNKGDSKKSIVKKPNGKSGISSSSSAAASSVTSAAVTTAPAAPHDAESILSKEEEIESTLKAKNEEMKKRRKNAAAAAGGGGGGGNPSSVISLVPFKSSTKPARQQNPQRPQSSVAASSESTATPKESVGNKNPAPRPRIQRPVASPRVETPKNGLKLVPKEAPPPPWPRIQKSKTPDKMARKSRSPSGSSDSRESTPKLPPPPPMAARGRTEKPRGADVSAKKTEDPTQWEDQPGMY